MTDTLLLVEDDRRLATFLADNLTADGFELLTAGTVRDAQRLLRERACRVAIVDVRLPDGSGLDLVDPEAETRFLVLSGLGTELDRVRGLQRGADDYLVKPFHYPELLLRVRSLLRRTTSGAMARRCLKLGPLELDAPTRAVRVRGKPVTLSAKEFALLLALAADPTRVFTKQELLQDVWGWRVAGTTRTLDSHACRLRRKLGFAGDRFVLNVWGVGYRLTEEA